MPSEGLLGNLRVLVTRPEPQAAPLCRMLEAEGAAVVAFPTVTIEPAMNRAELLDRMRALGPIDLAIFVSPNAVLHGLSLVLELPQLPAIAAIGPSTARALEAAGLRVDVRPVLGHTSEALLAEAALDEVADLRVAILRGGEGRELLADALARRGAQVHVFDVYARELPYVNERDLATLAERCRNREIDIIVATSVETLSNLHELLGPDAAAFLLPTPILTSSARIERAALRMGHPPGIIAAGPDPRSLVAAIREWRSRTTREADDR